MKVNGLRIYWQYEERITICIIEVDSNSSKITSAATLRSFKDINCKEKARKVSLKKALLSSSFGIYLNSNSIQNHREFRRQIWEAYRTMTAKPRW